MRDGSGRNLLGRYEARKNVAIAQELLDAGVQIGRAHV